MKEPQFITKIHRLLPQSVYRWKIHDRFHRGIPDTWYSGVAGDLWIEYKFTQKLPQTRITPRLSPSQKTWLNDRLVENKQLAVVVGDPDEAVVITNGAWNSSAPITERLTHREVAAWITHQVT